MRVFRVFAVLMLAAGMLVVVGAPALAQPPPNDTIDNATFIGAFPFSDVVDTTEATTDDVDAGLNEFCGAPSTDASVWYTFDVQEQTGIEVQVFESSFSAGVIVAVGPPDGLEVVACGPEAVFFIADPGATYWLLAFDDQIDGGGNGGELVINIEAFEVEPPPEVELTVDSVGSFDPRSGAATIAGTFTCTGSADFVEVFGELSQRTGRAIIRGFFFLFSEGENGDSGELICDGETHPWMVEVLGDNGLFRGGGVDINVSAVACGFFDCTEDFVGQQVRLRGSRSSN